MEQSLLFMHRTNMQRLFCIFSDVRTHLKISVCNMMSSSFSHAINLMLTLCLLRKVLNGKILAQACIFLHCPLGMNSTSQKFRGIVQLKFYFLQIYLQP